MRSFMSSGTPMSKGPAYGTSGSHPASSSLRPNSLKAKICDCVSAISFAFWRVYLRKQLIFKGFGNQPILGYVEFVFSSLGHYEVASLTDGRVTVPDYKGQCPEMAIVKPYDGHWPIVFNPAEQRGPVVCPKIAFPSAALWWRELPFSKPSTSYRGSGVNIGVIDIPGRRPKSLEHVQMYDIEGEPVNESSLKNSSHGLRVCAMIAERSSAPERTGIAPGVNLTLVDVSDELADDGWDYKKIGPAIQLLVDEFDVDIINLSGGCPLAPSDYGYSDTLAFFQSMVDYAASRGVLVVAATGNDSSCGVALPAMLSDVIGVGAIGKAGIAPSCTRTAAYELDSRNKTGCMGVFEGEEFFHYTDTSYGRGLDMVGPGIGVVMSFEGGYCIELDGTSYAAPYVSAVAACGLSGNVDTKKARGRKKHLQQVLLLRQMCCDLKMAPARQGAGVPVLTA